MIKNLLSGVWGRIAPYAVAGLVVLLAASVGLTLTLNRQYVKAKEELASTDAISKQKTELVQFLISQRQEDLLWRQEWAKFRDDVRKNIESVDLNIESLKENNDEVRKVLSTQFPDDLSRMLESYYPPELWEDPTGRTLLPNSEEDSGSGRTEAGVQGSR